MFRIFTIKELDYKIFAMNLQDFVNRMERDKNFFGVSVMQIVRTPDGYYVAFVQAYMNEEKKKRKFNYRVVDPDEAGLDNPWRDLAVNLDTEGIEALGVDPANERPARPRRARRNNNG